MAAKATIDRRQVPQRLFELPCWLRRIHLFRMLF
jgi:hypothetical protein